MGGYKTGIMCGYKTNHSKKNCAGMTAIRPITRKFFARKFFTRKFLDLWVYLKKKNFRFCFGFKTHYLQKVIFADLTFIRPITPKFRGGNDFYKTNHSKIHEIIPRKQIGLITTPLLYKISLSFKTFLMSSRGQDNFIWKIKDSYD